MQGDLVAERELPLGRRLLLAGAGEGRDEAYLHVHFAHAVIVDVADVEVTLGVEADAVWFIEARIYRRPAIAAEACDARAGDSRDGAALRIDAADEMVHALDEEQVAGAVEADFVRLVERGADRGAAIAGPAACAVTRDR